MKTTNHKRSLLISGAIFSLVTSSLFTPPANAVPNEWIIVGSGWGHGVGLSQYGALGQALDGRSWQDILNHYYPGTSLSDSPVDKQIIVGLSQDKTAVFVRLDKLTDDAQLEMSIDGNPVATIGSGTIIRIESNGNSVVTSGGADGRAEARGAGKKISFRISAGSGLINTNSGTPDTNAGSALSSPGHRYKYGTLNVVYGGDNDGRADLYTSISMRLADEYVLGIGEMSSSWPKAALVAQVVASRSYGLGKANSGIRGNCGCHIYNNATDQVYVGYSKESDAWKDAVNSALNGSGQPAVLTFGGKAITAYFASSTGGRTMSTLDAWGGNVAWSQSVDDNWSLNARNPNSRWGVRMSQSAMAAALGLSNVQSIDVVERYSSGAAKTLVAKDSNGGSVTISGRTFQARMKLKSTYVVGAVDIALADTLGGIPTQSGFDEFAYRAQQAAADIAALTPQYKAASEKADQAAAQASESRKKYLNIKNEIEKAQNELAELIKDIELREAEARNAQSQVTDSIRILYMQGSLDTLSVLLNSASPSEFTENLVNLSLFAESQDRIMKKSIELIKLLEVQKEEANSRKGELEVLLKEANAALTNAKSALKDAQIAEDKLKKLIEEKQKIIDAYNKSKK
jgi:SpoIID/LytB domain protein